MHCAAAAAAGRVHVHAHAVSTQNSRPWNAARAAAAGGHTMPHAQAEAERQSRSRTFLEVLSPSLRRPVSPSCNTSSQRDLTPHLRLHHLIIPHIQLVHLHDHLNPNRNQHRQKLAGALITRRSTHDDPVSVSHISHPAQSFTRRKRKQSIAG